MNYKSSDDKCFKCIFLDPLNKDLLSLITKETIGIELGNINYLNIEKNITIENKRIYLDALIDTKDYKINYEVYTRCNKYLYPKSTHYNCLSYIEELKVSGKYSEEEDIIQINYIYGMRDNKPIRRHTINDGEKNFVKNFIIYEVNMDYYMYYWYNRINQENLEYIKQYKYFIMLDLILEELKELLEITGSDERIEKFMSELERVNSSSLFRDFMSKEEDRILKNTIKDYAIKEGRKEGILETAKNMLKDKLSIETISKYTGLSIKEIKNICL